MNQSLLLKLEKVGIQINDKWLVKDVSLEVNRGEIVTLIGPNGSGKSTTVKIALGILKNFQGTVIKKTNKIGYIPQSLKIDWSMPLRVVDFMKLTGDVNTNEIRDALFLTGVSHLEKSQLNHLSGGEYQRVLIARAIAKKPQLLVLDEPVQAVDFNGEIAMYELIKKISEKLNCGILLISHDLHIVMSATDYVVCLNGHVCCHGTPVSVSKDKEYKSLFGEQASNILSVYQHHHDHQHFDDGTIKKKN